VFNCNYIMTCRHIG